MGTDRVIVKVALHEQEVNYLNALLQFCCADFAKSVCTLADKRAKTQHGAALMHADLGLRTRYIPVSGSLR
jgi:hypothetical protein